MQPRVVVVGSANMDLVALADALPGPGETVMGRQFAMVPGGKGANQAVAAARAGATTTLLGAIGSDSFGVTLKARITAAGVDTGLLRVVYGISGVAVIHVDRAGENAIAVVPGANDAFTGLTDAERTAIADADVLVAQLEIPLGTVAEAARAAQAGGTRVVVNAAPARAMPKDLLAAIDLLVVNEGEASGLDLLAVVPRAVVTLGARGALYLERDRPPESVPAYPVSTVDSTAAGDAFTAALAVSWAEGRDLLDAVRWACAAGAACVRTVGASPSLPTRGQIDEIYSS